MNLPQHIINFTTKEKFSIGFEDGRRCIYRGEYHNVYPTTEELELLELNGEVYIDGTFYLNGKTFLKLS